MFLRKNKHTRIRSNGRPFTMDVYYFICDTCKNVIIKKPKFLTKKHHFCNKKCMILAQKKGGIIHQAFEKHCIQKYGVLNPFADEDIKQKIKQTNQKKYGVDYAAQSKEICDKIKQTNIQRYGVASILSLNDVHELGIEAAKSENANNKRKQSLFKTFSDQNKKDEIVEKRIKTFSAKEGFDFPMQSPSVQAKSKQSLLKAYQVEFALQSEEIKLKQRQTMLEKFGVEFAMQNQELHSKAQSKQNQSFEITHWLTKQTLICRGTYELAFVKWANANYIDFDWQISFQTPLLTHKNNKSIYIVDAFVKNGILSNTWIEIKGYWRSDFSKKKWEWFQTQYPNSKLLMLKDLNDLGIMKGKNPFYD